MRAEQTLRAARNFNVQLDAIAGQKSSTERAGEDPGGAFRGSTLLTNELGVGWHEHSPCLFRGTERFFRTGYAAHLVQDWLPALAGVCDKLERGAKVSYADPFVPVVHGREWSGGFDIAAVDMTRGNIAQYDCVVIITDHKAFDYKTLLEEADLIVDTRNATRHLTAQRERIHRV